MQQMVYFFGDGKADGHAGLKPLLGGKGANLAEMSRIGLPVPPGITITTEVCRFFYENGQTYPATLKTQVTKGLEAIEQGVGSKFGDAKNPLLLSVRSGAPVSMPGMMDTILNLGLNDITVEGLAVRSQNRRFAFDSYRRFVHMYADVVMGVPHHDFEECLDHYKRDHQYLLDTDLNAEDWENIVVLYKGIVEKHLGYSFPQDVREQLWGAIGAVFKSWMVPRAVTYRKINHIDEASGTAVNIQAMVFGNMGDDCATGVAFTRDPSTGANIFYGEFLPNAQGEDVVAGTRTPYPLTLDAKKKSGLNGHALPSFEEMMPSVYADLCDVRDLLEHHFKDIQDIEFTVQNKKLWMLQTRSGKRTTAAALKIAVDMVNEGLIDKKTALLRIDPLSLNQLLHPSLDPKADKTLLARGLPASPGAATGEVVFSADRAEALAALGHPVILVRIETSPDDIHGMHAAKAIVTSRGGMTSHAAVVARGMGRPCVAGAGDLRIDYKENCFYTGSYSIREGDLITIDGAEGHIYLGEVPTLVPELSENFQTIMGWADAVRRMGVRANADTPEDAKVALSFGAEGIGLCRTEHMFFSPDRIPIVRQMILAETTEQRIKALTQLRPMQQQDFKGILQAMAGLPVTIRLLDPPLHEFLPHHDHEFLELAQLTGESVEILKQRSQKLRETNPMLGHRGCRLGVTYPEIYQMQAQAIFLAVAELTKEKIEVIPEIMVPLVMTKAELELMKAIIDAEAKLIQQDQGVSFAYTVGTMIELPRAALCADEIAEVAAFFSFGTNDLTQTTLGLSRDDAGSYLDHYLKHNVLPTDPFTTIDQKGVGALMEIAIEKGKKTRSRLKIGICGEHGGDPNSIKFCEKLKIDYVSCSPYRLPIARLAAAQAVIKS